MPDASERTPPEEMVAEAIFGVWREMPPLSPAKIATIWNDLAPAMKGPWLRSARAAISASGLPALMAAAGPIVASMMDYACQDFAPIPIEQALLEALAAAYKLAKGGEVVSENR